MILHVHVNTRCTVFLCRWAYQTNRLSNDALLPILRLVTDDRVNVKSVPYGDDIERRRCTWGRGEKILESIFGAPRDMGK